MLRGPQDVAVTLAVTDLDLVWAGRWVLGVDTLSHSQSSTSSVSSIHGEAALPGRQVQSWLSPSGSLTPSLCSSPLCRVPPLWSPCTATWKAPAPRGHLYQTLLCRSSRAWWCTV